MEIASPYKLSYFQGPVLLYLHQLDLNELQRGVTIDLSEDGSRWEGDSLNGDPYGYGCIYNSENELIYSGFVYDGMKVCYGNVFYAFVGIIEYSGNFYNNIRCGYGKLYDKKNTLVYEGEWYNDNPIELSSLKIEELKENVIHFGLEELEINIDCTCDSDYFSFFGLTNLKKITFYRCNYLFLWFDFLADCKHLIDNDNYSFSNIYEITFESIL